MEFFSRSLTSNECRRNKVIDGAITLSIFNPDGCIALHVYSALSRWLLVPLLS